MNFESLLLAKATPKDVPPPYFLVIGIVLVALGLKSLYDWRAAAKKAAIVEPSQHLSPAQQRVRDMFKINPRQYKMGAIIWLLMGAFFIGLYFVVSRA